MSVNLGGRDGDPDDNVLDVSPDLTVCDRVTRVGSSGPRKEVATNVSLLSSSSHSENFIQTSCLNLTLRDNFCSYSNLIARTFENLSVRRCLGGRVAANVRDKFSTRYGPRGALSRIVSQVCSGSVMGNKFDLYMT